MYSYKIICHKQNYYIVYTKKPKYKINKNKYELNNILIIKKYKYSN